METKDYVTLVIALLGLGLGILNYFQNAGRDRVKLKVIPLSFSIVVEGQMVTSTIHPIEGGSIGIKIINLSSFPVTISDVGFTLKDPSNRAALTPPYMVSDGGSLPYLLASRSEITLGTIATNVPEGVVRAYATTSCKSTAYGNSPAFRTFLKERTRLL